MGGRVEKGLVHIKNGPHLLQQKITSRHLTCNLHKIGANLHSNLAFPPFSAKKYGPVWIGGWMDGWMGGWMDRWIGGRAGLRIAYSNQK